MLKSTENLFFPLSTRFQLFYSFIFGLIFNTLSSASYAKTDPKTEWQVLETPHFEIIYDARQQSLGRSYARYAETAYKILSPSFEEAPRKTTVWVNNTTDISNGAATAIPYPTIVAYPTLPLGHQSIGSYGHWGQELMTHEYTHILQFTPVHGFFKGLRYIFGSIVTPNGVLPRWWLEGMAVETESQFSNGGRLRSYQQQATLRALVLENKLDTEDISRVNESSIPDWLGGQRPYLFGSLIWNEIVNEHGTEALNTLAQKHSNRVPFFINQPIEDLNNKKDYKQILQKAYANIKNRTSEQIETLNESSSNKKTPWLTNPSTQSSPAISPNQKHLSFINYHIDEGKLLKIQQLEDKKFLSVPGIRPFSRVEWSPDSKQLVFDRISRHQRYYTFSDIYTYNLEKQKIQQITFGARAREPAFSSDGQRIVFIKNFGEKLKLVEISLNTLKEKTLYSPKKEFRISHPVYIDDNKVVFAQKDRLGHEKLFLFDIEKRTSKPILQSFPFAYHPQWSSLGLTFISEKTGVANLYLANKGLSSAKALTNSKTAIYSSAWNKKNKQLLLSELTANGPQIFSVDNSLKSRAPLSIGLTVPYERPKFKKPSVKFKAKRKKYSPWKYLLPHYWIPYAALSTDGLFLQASTGSRDPLGKHSYSALAGYDTGTQKINSSFSYLNQTTDTPISASFLDIYDFFGGGLSIRRQTLMSLSASRSLSSFNSVNDAKNNTKFSPRWTGSAAWSYQRTDSAGSITSRQGPRVSAKYSNLTYKGDSFAPHSGGDLLLSVNHYIKSFGTLGYTSTKATGTYYFSKWFPKYHTLSSKLRAVYSPQTANELLATGVTTASGSFSNSLISNQLLMRGYLSGNFIGQNVLNASFEYIFPLKFSYNGWDTKPIFSRKWHGRIIADVISQDGVFFDQQASTFRTSKVGDLFTSAGGEIHWNTTIAYHVPFRVFMGFYYGLNAEASGGFQSFLGFSL